MSAQILFSGVGALQQSFCFALISLFYKAIKNRGIFVLIQKNLRSKNYPSLSQHAVRAKVNEKVLHNEKLSGMKNHLQSKTI
ncbi:MAG: hypothetical protein MI921_10210 [Cytophagales bacterium]|nr:hypothetical protein [Cytophagales bacterium]